ncbi:MAG: hypothetical protein LBK95_15385 [Bifidobacteriaceae bacterium]|nr:hypothetical protein [Bifidobacteriaceae bacterium]
MEVANYPSARKRGFTDAQIVAAWDSGQANECWLDGREPRRYLRIGWDQSGAELETVALVFDDRRVLIHHCMKARKSSWRLVEHAQRRKQ